MAGGNFIVGPKGEIYILLENAAGSRIIRLVPD